MSEAQFERALSTEQMREALALLDGTANTKLGKLEVGNPAPAEPAADPASTTAAENWVSAEADPRHRKMRFNLVVAFSGLGIAATAALTLLPWSEGELVSSAQPRTSSEQRANLQPTQVQDSGSIPFSANLEFNQGSFASERRDSKADFAGPNPVDQTNRAEDQAAAAGKQTWWIARTSSTPKELSWRTPADRVAIAKKRLWRRHWQHFAQTNGAACFHTACPLRRKQPIFYEPPRTVTQ